MIVTHLLASPFVGGIERQLLGLAAALPASYRTVFLSFAERGLAQPFLQQAQHAGFEAIPLAQNAPHYVRAAREVASHLRRVRADVLCCSGYKPDVIGWMAARRVGIPVLSISHGWTAATLKVRLNEALDRVVLRWMDCTVCVSARQAERVRRALVPAGRVRVIRNAIRAQDFDSADPAYGRMLRSFFPTPVRRIVGAAGRLSPEKGFDQLIKAAQNVVREDAGIGFVLFGDGPQRAALIREIAVRGLEGRFILGGFRTDLARFLPHFDLFTLPSYTEGLPVVVLEAFAAQVPVVATAVGGTPEVVEDGVSGFLVPSGNPQALADRIRDALRDEKQRAAMGLCGRRRVEQSFTFTGQAREYQRLFERLVNGRLRKGTEEVIGNGKPLIPARTASFGNGISHRGSPVARQTPAPEQAWD